MKPARRICIVVTAMGVLLLVIPRDVSFDTLPFPAAGLTVKMSAHVAQEGSYRLVVGMPKADREVALTEESVPCSLVVTLMRSGQPSLTNQVTSLSRYAEYGFSRIQYYKGGNWHLGRGDYDVEVSSLGNCAAAVSRGATLSIEQEAPHITERFIAAGFAHLAGIVLSVAGLLVLALGEFKRANKALQATAAAPSILTET